MNPRRSPLRPRRSDVAGPGGDGGDTNPVVDYLTSREGKDMVKKLTRGVPGTLRKRL